MMLFSFTCKFIQKDVDDLIFCLVMNFLLFNGIVEGHKMLEKIQTSQWPANNLKLNHILTWDDERMLKFNGVLKVN